MDLERVLPIPFVLINHRFKTMNLNIFPMNMVLYSIKYRIKTIKYNEIIY